MDLDTFWNLTLHKKLERIHEENVEIIQKLNKLLDIPDEAKEPSAWDRIEAVADELGLDTIDLENFDAFQNEVFEFVPSDVARRFAVLPVDGEKNEEGRFVKITFATAKLTELEGLVDALLYVLKLQEVELVLTSPTQIHVMLDYYYGEKS